MSCRTPWMGPAVTEGNSRREMVVERREVSLLFFI